MVQRERESPLDEFAVRVARKTVRRLVGAWGFTASDRQDLEQELLLEVLRRLPRFDPARGRREPFVASVVANTAADLIQHRRAECRDWRRASSLHDEAAECDGRRVELWRTLDEEACRERRGLGCRDEAAREDLRIDVAAAVAQLPEELQAVCLALACGSVREVARKTGVPRWTVRAQVARIQAHLVACGLASDLQRPAPTCEVAPVCKQWGRHAAPLGRIA